MENKKLELDESTKKEILKRCFSKTMNNNVYCSDEDKINIYVRKIGTISLSGKTIKRYALAYLNRFACPEEKKMYDEYVDILKRSYDAYKKIMDNKDNKDEIIDLSGLDLNYKTICKRAHKYCHLIRNMSENDIKKANHKPGKYSLILAGLTKLDKEEEIIEYLDKFCEKELKIISTLRTSVFDHVVVNYNELSREEQNKIIQELKRKVNTYAKYSSSLKRDIRIKNDKIERENRYKEEVIVARNTIVDFIKSKMTLREYLSKNNIDSSTFIRYKKVLEIYDPEVYKFYKERKNFQHWESYIKYSDTAKGLLDNINNGVIVNDGKREFDILDYYLIYNVPLEDLSRAIEFENRNIKYEDYLKLRCFISAHMEDKALNVKEILETNLEIDSKRDSNGFPIPGTGTIINKEERQSIITYLEENRVPLTNSTYRIALNRYIESIKSNEKSNNKVLKKI